MTLGVAVAKETGNGENRVALIPDTVERLRRAGMDVRIQSGAGGKAGYPDGEYERAGATLVTDDEALWKSADIVLRVGPPELGQVRCMRKGGLLIGFLDPHRNLELMLTLRDRNVTAFAMELIPRTTRAQAMDALSSQRSVAGYRGAILAAECYGRFFPMLTTPTGTVRPATVLTIGAGVAGLQAIATARRLGAVVEASDVRAAAREQVESLGGRFIAPEVDAEAAGGYARELDNQERKAQRELLAQHVARAHAVITTAEIPGQPAPRIVSAEMVERMRPGSVVIDLAASSGGNCALTKPGQRVRHRGVLIYGPRNAAAEMAPQASELYARNLYHLLMLLAPEGELRLDWEDDILAESCLSHGGEFRYAPLRARQGEAR